MRDPAIAMAKIPNLPANPERICWGCNKYCPADDLACGNGTVRTPHPCELFGEDWLEWSLDERRANSGRTFCTRSVASV